MAGETQKISSTSTSLDFASNFWQLGRVKVISSGSGKIWPARSSDVSRKAKPLTLNFLIPVMTNEDGQNETRANHRSKGKRIKISYILLKITKSSRVGI